MIPLNIKRTELGYVCFTDKQYAPLGYWLETDLGRSGGGGVAEELFQDIGAFLAGRKENVEVWGDLARVRIGRKDVLIQVMLPSSPGRPCKVSLDELVDAVLRWFDVVNPRLASYLRKIQSTWEK
jgi:hypothetical protein